MSKKFEQQLKPCPFCGGRGRLRRIRTKSHLTIGATRSFSRELIYIQCEDCHAQTQGRAKVLNIVDAWNRGNVYPRTIERDALNACPSLF